MKAVSKTLIIGLGGTGQSVIRDIKKRLLRTYGEIPPLVKFLAFDTDEIQNGIDSGEFYRLQYPRFDLLEHYPICSEKLNIEELRKLYGLDAPLAFRASRVMGRACLLYSSNEIIRLLSATITEIRAARLSVDAIASGYVLTADSINVFVIASLAEGMGSGAIMDMSRMLQVAGINTTSYAYRLDSIYGMFFLPRLFEGTTNAKLARVNTYAALSELDYTLGLSDSTRFPEGCAALLADRNDYSGYPNDKRVVYDGVFLVDALSPKGHVYSMREVSGKVASSIVQSIVIGSCGINLCFITSAHRRHSVKGKFQNYSSLGYCEIRFNRQELVKYLLNRKLLYCLERYKAGEQSVGANEIAQSFLDPRWQQNQLTDDIIDMTSILLKYIDMKHVDLGREAANEIEINKRNYLRAIDATAQEMIQSFAEWREKRIRWFRASLEQRMKEKGFGVLPDLVCCLKTMLTEMKDELEDEMNRNEALYNQIEQDDLRCLRETVAENNGRGVLGIGNKRDEQKAAISLYCDKVLFAAGGETNPTLAWLRVDSARKKEAVAFYEEMIGILDEYYKEEIVETVNGPMSNVSGFYLSVNKTYTGLVDALLKECNGYCPSKAAANETVFADAYFKEYFDQRGIGDMDLSGYGDEWFEKYIGDLLSNPLTADESLLAEMRLKLLEQLPSNGPIRKMHECNMSIDELFIHCFGKYGEIVDIKDFKRYPQLELLEQVDALLEPLWCYRHFSGYPQSISPSEEIFVGVCDPLNHIFNKENGYSAALRWDVIHRDVCFGDPDRIAFIMTENGVPANCLEGVEDWAKEFDQMKDCFYAFSDKRLEDIDMIVHIKKE